MRIETFEDFGKKYGCTILGAVKIQYPVYNLHLKMLTKDVDPYFPIDRAIVTYATLQPDIDFAYLSALVGLEESFVRWRVRSLLESYMLSLDGVKYEVTDNGERKYLAEDPVQKDRVIYGNLVVDGNTLDLLDESFYKNNAWLLDRKSDILPHKPLLSVKDPSIKKTLKRLERMTPAKKADYCLEAASHDYEVTGFDAQILDDVFVVFSSDNDTGESRRHILYRGKVLNIEKLAEEANKFYFSVYEGVVDNSQGYHPKDGDPLFYFTEEQIIIYLQKRYEAKDIRPSDFEYCEKTSKRSPYPLTLKVTEDLLYRVKKTRQLIVDAIRGTVREPVRVGQMRNVEIGFFNIHVEDLVPVYTTLYSKVNNWEGKLDREFVEKELAVIPEWRKILVHLKCCEELEEIDINQFIKNYGHE